MPSSQLDSIYGWRTSEEACHHGPFLQNTVERYRAWKEIIALEQHRQGRITSGVAYHYHPWRTFRVGQCWEWHVIINLGLHTRLDDVVHDNTIISIGHYTQLGVKCHHCLLDSTDCRMTSTWIAHTDERRRAWHVLIALVLYIQSNDV